MARPVVIGLTGGIASGKSTIATLFARLGALVLDADQIGHDVLEQQEVKLEIKDTWGDTPFLNGRVDRRSLAKIVFDTEDTDELAKLERITHPRIGRRIEERLNSPAMENCVAAVLDAPLLFEAGWDRYCDKLVFVEANESLRLQRAQARGWSEEELRQRESRQMSVFEKRQRCTDSINNSVDLESVFSQAKLLWKAWKLPIPKQLAS